MRITSIEDDAAEGSWDAYVAPRTSTVTDLCAWRRVVREAYGIRSHFLAAREADRITGVLALFEFRHPVFGHYLATAPFGNDGGLLTDGGEARDLLLAEARRLADALDVAYLVIRTRGEALPGFQTDTRYCTAVVPLTEDPQQLWSERLPAKTRNQVRRGMKEGFSLSVGSHEIGAFYDVFQAHMRDLGSPAHGMRFYRAIERHLGQHAEFLVARDGSEVVAGALLFQINGVATNYHTVALRQYNRRCPNYFLYWSMIERSCQAGCSRFDMGRSPADSSNLRFKQNWNPDVIPLAYNYHLRTAKKIPFADPRNPRYRLPIAVWRRLPLRVTRALGPRLIRGLA